MAVTGAVVRLIPVTPALRSLQQSMIVWVSRRMKELTYKPAQEVRVLLLNNEKRRTKATRGVRHFGIISRHSGGLNQLFLHHSKNCLKKLTCTPAHLNSYLS